jgi:hypothetical protein
LYPTFSSSMLMSVPVVHFLAGIHPTLLLPRTKGYGSKTSRSS